MKNTNERMLSRPVATAELLGELAADRHRFTEKRVLITGEKEVLETENGKLIFEASVRLATKICKFVTIFIPSDVKAFSEDAEKLLNKLAFGSAKHEIITIPNYTKFDAILSVGSLADPLLPWTVINSNGWTMRVSSGDKNINRECDVANPIAALAAASIGIAEVFKRLIRVASERGELLNGLEFSLYSYRHGFELGPSLPSSSNIHAVLAGGGAIGNGVAFLLSKLKVTGKLSICDKQRYEEENLGTCLLLTKQELGQEKADFLAGICASENLKVSVNVGDIGVFLRELDQKREFPNAIFGALDNIDARWAMQDSWPNLIIDGAIGDFGCQVSCHPADGDVACLRCLFKKPVRESIALKAIQEAGLTIDRANYSEALVSDEDVSSAPPDRQLWLKDRVGRTICSVLSEAEVAIISAEERDGFEPSVPFVATLSSSLMVGEYIKSVIGAPNLDPRFQFDVLRGPQNGVVLSQGRSKNCSCLVRRHNIEALRQSRFPG